MGLSFPEKAERKKKENQIKGKSTLAVESIKSTLKLKTR